LNEIHDRLEYLRAAYPNIITTNATIGLSLEGRRIAAARITGSENKLKKRVYWQGGQHAREWIGPAVALYIFEQLASLYNIDDEVTYFVDNVEFIVVPVVNADGYNYTWTTNRNWRKNRRPNVGGSFGVDLNRNWNDHWSLTGSSNVPSSDTYHGTAPFSEVETYVVSRFIQQIGAPDAAIDYHSYGQLILRPYGWTTVSPPDDWYAKAAGDQYQKDIFDTSRTQYTSQNAWQLYASSGTARDWFNSQGGSPIGYTIELRDTGTYGFQLPPNQIIPTANENWAAFKGLVRFVLEH